MTKFSTNEHAEFAAAYNEAYAVGYNAGTSHNPTPMRVYQADIGGNRLSEDVVIDDGPCGFAWINIKSANKRFCKWLREYGLADTDSYYGGITIWIGAHGQSYERKQRHAKAMADAIQELFPELKVRAMSRLD